MGSRDSLDDEVVALKLRICLGLKILFLALVIML